MSLFANIVYYHRPTTSTVPKLRWDFHRETDSVKQHDRTRRTLAGKCAELLWCAVRFGSRATVHRPSLCSCLVCVCLYSQSVVCGWSSWKFFVLVARDNNTVVLYCIYIFRYVWTDTYRVIYAIDINAFIHLKALETCVFQCKPKKAEPPRRGNNVTTVSLCTLRLVLLALSKLLAGLCFRSFLHSGSRTNA